jgi:hypothetical protein
MEWLKIGPKNNKRILIIYKSTLTRGAVDFHEPKRSVNIGRLLSYTVFDPLTDRSQYKRCPLPISREREPL